MTIYSLDVTDMTNNANLVKDVLLAVLEADGLLTKPSAEIASNYAVVVSKPGWLGKFFHKLQGNDSDKNLRFDVLKRV